MLPHPVRFKPCYLLSILVSKGMSTVRGKIQRPLKQYPVLISFYDVLNLI